MKRATGCFLVALVVSACSESPAGMLDTARFEEKQGNRPHAEHLYREIVRKHPGSSEAAEAEKRLKSLSGG